MDLTKEHKKAILIIRSYLNKNFSDEYILSHFELAIDELIENVAAIKSIKPFGVKSMSENNQSLTFSDSEAWTITDNVKSFLPSPYVKLMG